MKEFPPFVPPAKRGEMGIGGKAQMLNPKFGEE
jgi:hypothetical protein